MNPSQKDYLVQRSIEHQASSACQVFSSTFEKTVRQPHIFDPSRNWGESREGKHGTWGERELAAYEIGVSEQSDNQI